VGHAARANLTHWLGIAFLAADLEDVLNVLRGLWIHAPGHFAPTAFNRTLHPALGRRVAITEQAMRIEKVPALFAKLVFARNWIL
ncbi:MAG: hypothetical protein ACJ8OJ_01800, partial [Povalibacter sp.]